MSLMHVTKENKCAYCGAKLILCEVCKEFFHAKNVRHVICRNRCRMRKHRKNKKLEQISSQDKCQKTK